MIAAIICAADFADSFEDHPTGDFLRHYADWMAASLERWTVTQAGELVAHKPRHYVRITPGHPEPGLCQPDTDTTTIQIANGGGSHPARNIVDAGFLSLVRLGIRAADDPIMLDSIAVVDEVLRRDLSQGPCWRRYNHDGYGQQSDGSAYDGTGEGRCWPLLTGERGHYELAAGRDPLPYIKALEGFANAGGMLTEQLWDADEIPEMHMKFGQPSGAAMPLCWAHAEYISLVRSHLDGVCFDRIEPVYQRYAVNKTTNRVEIWTFAYQPQSIGEGKPLRIICESSASIHWSSDSWQSSQDLKTKVTSLGLHFVDLPIEKLDPGSKFQFTFHWSQPDGWQGDNFSVEIRSHD